MVKKLRTGCLLLMAAAMIAGCGVNANGDVSSQDGGMGNAGATNSPVKGGGPDTTAKSAVLMGETTQGDFVYRLYADKSSYKEGEQPVFTAELEYTGPESSVTIAHAASPFYYALEDVSGKYGFYFAMNEPLIQTTLKRGEPLTENYAHGQMYTEPDEEHALGVPTDVPFPEGEYRVGGYVDFWMANDSDAEERETVKFGIDTKEALTIKVAK